MTYPELDFFFLLQEDAPEYYTLRFDQVTPAIVIGLHELILKYLVSEHKKWPVVKDIQEELEKENQEKVQFVVDYQKGLGFGCALLPYSQGLLFQNHAPANFKEFTIPIPTLEEEVGKCDECGGSGGDNDYDRECLYCFGSGKKTAVNHRALHNICATLSLLSQTVLYYPSKALLAPIEKTKKYSRQLLVFQSSFSKDGRAFIGATISPVLAKWLAEVNSNRIKEVRDATQRSYLQMFPSYKRFTDKFSFPLRLDGGRLSFDVPGDATCLYTESGSSRYKGGGVELHDHNVDSHAQQVTLLSGLAALYNLARKELAEN